MEIMHIFCNFMQRLFFNLSIYFFWLFHKHKASVNMQIKNNDEFFPDAWIFPQKNKVLNVHFQ